MALNLEKAFVGAVLFGNDAALKEGDLSRRTKSIISVPTGLFLRGRVVDPLGQPLDGKGALTATKQELIERKAPGIQLRARIDSPMATGIRAVDSLVPIGNGQRELIIGDRQVGKTAIAIDTIIHQTKLRQLEADYVTSSTATSLGAEKAGSTCVYGAEMRLLSWNRSVPESDLHHYWSWYPPVFRASHSGSSSMVRITNSKQFKEMDELQASEAQTSPSHLANLRRRVLTTRVSGCKCTFQQRVAPYHSRDFGTSSAVSDELREPKLDSCMNKVSQDKRQGKGTFNMLPISKECGGRSGERVTGFAALVLYNPNKFALTCEGPQLGSWISHAIAVLTKIKNVDFETFKIIELAQAMGQIHHITRKSRQNLGYLGKVNLKTILSNPTFLLYCFNLLKKTNAAGIDYVTTVGMTKRGILKLAKQLQDETYRPRPTKRVMIPKADNKLLRPLGIASTKDKVIQQAFKLILEPIFEPTFSHNSHGFRPNRSCHRALREIDLKWPNTVWFLEFDFKQAFDRINHRVLMAQLSRRFNDEFAMKIIWRMLKTGYILPFNLADSQLELTEGTPQGSILSPLLANVYFNPLDHWIKDELIPKYSKNYTTNKTVNKEYSSFTNHWKNNEWTPILKSINELSPNVSSSFRRKTLAIIRKEEAKHLGIPYNKAEDKFRLTYSRFADDFLLGYMGSKDSAREILQEILLFCESDLKMSVNSSKTGIKHRKEGVMYLGYKIWLNGGDIPRKIGDPRKSRSRLMFTIPVDKLYKRYADRGFFQKVSNNKSQRYAGRRQDKWLFASPYLIIMKYNAVVRGIIQYYSGSERLSNLNKFLFDLRRSAALTLAHHFNQKSASWAFEKFGRTLRVSQDAKHNSKSRTVEFYFPSLESKAHGRWKGQFGDINQLTREPMEGFPHPVSRTVVNSASDLPCSIPGCTKQAKHWHHIKHKRKVGGKGIQRKIVLVDANQIAVCLEHHTSIHGGTYDGPSLRKLKGYC